MSYLEETYYQKRVLITGHTGFKGTWLCKILRQIGAEVTGYSKDEPLSPRKLGDQQTDLGFQDLRGDIRDFHSLQNVFNDVEPDFVFHLAAQAIVSRSYQDPLETISTNVLGTANVLQAVRGLTNSCTAVVITSDKVYRNNEWLWGYKETDELGGHDPYSASKAAAELSIGTFAKALFDESPSRLAVARAGNVIGGGDWSKDRIIPDCARSWRESTPVKLRSWNAVRPWQHVLEPLRGYLLLGQRLSTDESLHGEAFNFGPRTEDCRTVGELVKYLGKDWDGFSFESQEVSHIGHEANLLKLNCEKAREFLGWEPRLNFETSVQLTADWHREFKESNDQLDISGQQINEYFSVDGVS
jgi:CDP-glucose 4,6-dehydratase